MKIAIIFLTSIIGFLENFIFEKHKISQKDKIQWIKIEDSKKLLNKNPKKKIFLFIYDNWCYYCKKMEKETLNNKDIIKYINKNFIPVKIDSETKDIIAYEAKKYKFSKKINIKNLTYYLLNEDIVYPSILFINKNNKINVLKGFFSSKEFLNQLKFFKKNI